MSIVAKVVVQNVPMHITFDKAEVEFICETLGNAIEQAYGIYDMFYTEPPEIGDEEW